MLPSTYRHLITVQGLLLSEDIETLVERNISSPGWDAQTEVPERLEGDGLVIAVSTAQGGLQLANKQVNQVGIIPPDVTLPRLHGLLAHTMNVRTSVVSTLLWPILWLNSTLENCLFQCRWELVWSPLC